MQIAIASAHVRASGSRGWRSGVCGGDRVVLLCFRAPCAAHANEMRDVIRGEKEPLCDPTKIAPANDVSRCLCGQLGVVFN